MRDYRLYLDDISKAIKKIEKYTKGLTFQEFKNKDLVIDAVARNLEIIGETAKNIPTSIKQKCSNIEWGIIKNKLPDLKKKIFRLRK